MSFRPGMYLDFLVNSEFWKYVSIPFVAAGVGWGTNWLAIQMSYWPLEFVGIAPPYLGWQGIIPSKARKMSSIGVDSTLSELAGLREIFDQLDPERIAHVDTIADQTVGIMRRFLAGWLQFVVVFGGAVA